MATDTIVEISFIFFNFTIVRFDFFVVMTSIIDILMDVFG